MYLKLYVWEGFEPDYTEGLAVAIAKTEEEAKTLILEQAGGEVYEWGRLSVRDIRPFGRCVCGGG